jgi:hypothetical protein
MHRRMIVNKVDYKILNQAQLVHKRKSGSSRCTQCGGPKREGRRKWYKGAGNGENRVFASVGRSQ